MDSSSIFTAPFDDPDGDKALYVPRTGDSVRVLDDPRVNILVQHGFKHTATHGVCAVLLPADIARARSVLSSTLTL